MHDRTLGSHGLTVSELGLGCMGMTWAYGTPDAAEVERTLHEGGNAGKRLDFLAQELNREANTLASRAATQKIADCALAPALFFADWVEPIAPSLANTTAYRARLLKRPSFARAVDEARPFRQYFPPGAPDRD